MEEELDHRTVFATNDKRSVQEHDRKNHWTKCMSDKGETCFTNVVTGQVTWTKPDESVTSPGNSTVEYSVLSSTTICPIDTAAFADTASDHVLLWLELFDSARQMAFYFAPQSGEILWTPPPKATALVRQCNSDVVLSAVVSLQNAGRSKQARTRVAVLRQQKRSTLRLEGVQAVDTSGNRKRRLGSEFEVVQVSADLQWVEVFDPATQQQYYYSPHSSETCWDPPKSLVSFTHDQKVAAAIAIQSLSRGQFARKRMNELRAVSSQRRAQKLHANGEDECDRAAMCHGKVEHQELPQLRGDGRFWGLDTYEREILQRQIDEERVARTKQTALLFFQPSNMAPFSQLCSEIDEEDSSTERLLREQEAEVDARTTMNDEEAQQRQNGDNFWGIEVEELKRNAIHTAMAEQEAAHYHFASATWEAEVQENAAKELAARGELEQRMQAKYLSWFYGQCVSVDELLGYRWPTKQQLEQLGEASAPVERRQPSVIQSLSDSATPYLLDDLVVRSRLEHGNLRSDFRSILTFHHQGVRSTTGSHFEIHKASPECAFDKATAAVLSKDQVLASSFE